MRKKILGIIAVTLTASVLAATLTGCGTRAKATDQGVVMEEEPIIVTDEEDSKEVTIETEDEITETEEVIADDDEADEDASYTEHEYFFALDKQDDSTAEDIDWDAMKPDGNDYLLKGSVNIYGSGMGRIAGYTKPDINVYVVTSSDDWYCIEFADEEPAYQLLLVKAEDFIEASGMYEDMPAITADDIKFALIPQLGEMAPDVDDEVYYIPLDEPTEEMTSVSEFTIPTYCKDVDGWMAQVIADNDFGNYQFFYIEKVEDKSDEENSCFRVTYGRLQKFAQ